jgi:dihydrofolate reductase
MKLIAAISLNGVIGDSGGIPWKCREDQQFFKFLTMGTSCLVGRKTYNSVRNLKGREFIVLSRDKDLDSIFFNGYPDFVIGGAETYRFCLELGLVEEAYISVIQKVVQGDTVMPTLTGLRKVSEFRLSDACITERWIK